MASGIDRENLQPSENSEVSQEPPWVNGMHSRVEFVKPSRTGTVVRIVDFIARSISGRIPEISIHGKNK